MMKVLVDYTGLVNRSNEILTNIKFLKLVFNQYPITNAYTAVRIQTDTNAMQILGWSSISIPVSVVLKYIGEKIIHPYYMPQTKKTLGKFNY